MGGGTKVPLFLCKIINKTLAYMNPLTYLCYNKRGKIWMK